MAQFTGMVTAISPIQGGTSKSGKQWRKIDVCLTYDNSKPEWPKAIKFSVMNDNIEKFGLAVGGSYTVEVDFSVRAYGGKYYMDASCWRAMAASQPMASQIPNPQPFAQPAPSFATSQPTNPFAATGTQPNNPFASTTQDGQGDDLPFNL